MKITIIHPSRSRPAQAAATAKAWLSSAKHPELIEYILSIDKDDPNRWEYSSLVSPTSFTLYEDYNASAIEAINNAAQISTGDILIVVSDDFNQPPFHWDEALRQALQGKSDFIVKTDDGAQPWIITLPIMDRVYYRRFGYVYNPAYKHMFADTEMTHVGEMLGRIVKLPMQIKHNHYTTGNTGKDAINEKNDKTWNQGEQVYLERLMSNFGIGDEEIDNSYLDRIHTSHVHWLNSKGIIFAAS